jgi:prephenate dehydratase
LIVLKGATKKGNKAIFSHSQPIGQCQEYIRKNFPKVKTIAVNSTAEAVKRIKKEKQKSQAAIGSQILAELEGLKIIDKDIASHKDNLTRFVVISKKPLIVLENAKTSFVFSILKDKPGGLYEILGLLAK